MQEVERAAYQSTTCAMIVIFCGFNKSKTKKRRHWGARIKYKWLL